MTVMRWPASSLLSDHGQVAAPAASSSTAPEVSPRSPSGPHSYGSSDNAHQALDDSLAIFGWIVRRPRGTFTLRDVHRAFPRRFPTAAHVGLALDDLTELGCIRRLPARRRVPSARNPKGAGRLPSPEFGVNWQTVAALRGAWLAMRRGPLSRP
jgi:hypothetical protein